MGYLENGAVALRWLFLQALVSRLQKDILPKIENQISELAKQDEPNEITQTITQQLKVSYPAGYICNICLPA